MWWFVAILTLVTFDLVEGQGAGAVYSQECEQVIDGTPSYYACLGLPEYILFSDNANYKITSTPNNLTCGVLGPSIAYTLGFFTKAPCDNANSHPVSHMVDYVETIEQGRQPNYQTYWQSVTWWDIWDDTLVPLTRNEPPKMDIEINFDQRYQLQNDLVIFFNSSRPRKMTLFKSVDYGLNWTVWQYYDLECNDLTNSGEAVSVVTAEDPTAILCSSEYGDVRPYSGGVVRLDVEKDRYALFAGPNIQNYEQLYKAFETTDLIDFLTFTDIRISLEYPASTGDEYTGREIDLVRSWTAITDIQLVTACSCNLHARYCIQQETDGVNHTVCECQHNTMGKNCELCKPLYRNRPWLAGSYEPYPEGRANECQKCQCYDHAESCEYSIDDAMGICENCTHNTEGKNCQLCIPGYYHNASVPLNDPNTCAMCGCEPFGVTNASDAVCNSIGQCDCKVQVQGLKCDECIDMYYGLTAIEPFGECKGCQCNLQGTISKSNICEKENGQCPCKENICGRDCGECCDGYYSFPNVVSRGCLDCNCDPGGAYDTPCDPINGQCNCKPGLRGQYCNIADQGTYIPFYDAYQYQPASGGCDPKSALLTEEEPFTGHEFYECSTSLRTIFDRVDGANLIQPTVTWLYNPSFRYTYKSSAPWSKATLIITYAGNSNLQNLPKYQDATATVLTPACPVPDIGALLKEKIIYDLEPGIGQAWISDEAYSFDARCVYQATITMDAPGANSSSTILVDSLVLLPNLQESAVYKKADNATKRAYLECQTTIASLRTRAAAYTNPNCRTMSFAAMTELTGQALDCNCNGVGALPETPCEAFGGQCPCKAGVFGRRCDSCQPGFYAFSSTGCTVCPYLPCPESKPRTAGDDDTSISIVLILIIILIICLIILLIFFLSRRRYRDRIFKKCTRSEGVSYISLPEDKQTTQNPLYQSIERLERQPQGEEELKFDVQTRKVESPVMSDNEFERGGSVRSHEPIIKMDCKQREPEVEKKRINPYKDEIRNKGTYFDNKAYFPDEINGDDVLMKGIIQKEVKPRRKLPEPQKPEPQKPQKLEPVISENLPSELQKEPHPLNTINTTQPPKAVGAPRRQISSASSRKLPQIPNKVAPQPPLTTENVVPPISIAPIIPTHSAGPRSVDGRKRKKRAASSVHSVASMGSTVSGVHGTRRKRTLPTPTPKAAEGASLPQVSLLEKQAKDKANADILQKPKKEPKKRSLPDIPSAVAAERSSEQRPKIGRQLPEAGILPDMHGIKPRSADKVGRSASTIQEPTTQPVNRKKSSASDGPQRKKRDLPQPPSKKPGFESLWETDEVKGSLV
ncbi:hypothetical protein CAPTEDRAFT_214680 [Capitella teleta]|uniref:Laminin EGF-like domain-containing protein n=1 Tax=Capitella teleta TaxID=283909 RepID=R7UGG6_CAPTE|nr:hypothetical protein CAPTEDRAFT_214680 [Capitella teleta]|eukprot:ELU05178.1 hypothetical protein CAPTEDRAFT_214680 [Capitella teleta]